MKFYNILTAIAVLIVFAAFQPNSVIAENIEYGVYIDKASDKFTQRDIPGAISTLNEGIKVYPNNPLLYLNRGFVEHFLQDYESAMADYNKAISIKPDFAYAYNNRGALKVSINDISGAFDDYDKALSINPKYADAYYNRANLKYMVDDNKGALEDYDKAISLNPKDSDAYNNRGVVKKRMNFNVGALSDYSQAIAINPNDSIAYGNRGRLKKLYFDNEGATIDLNQAISLAENQVFIKNVKPLLSNQHYIAAIPTVSNINSRRSNITPDKINSQDNISQEKIAMYSPNPENLISKKDTEKPVQKVVEPVKAKPEKEVKTVAAKPKEAEKPNTLNAGVGKVVIAEAPDIRTTAVTKNATTNKKLAESYYIRGLQKCILHDLSGAVADLDKAIANNSKYADAYFYRAAIKKELGDNDGFKKDYAEAIQIKPSLQTYNDIDALSLAG